MERGPHREAVTDGPPDLLEAFADQEITIFGMTGTFRELAGVCPVNLSDPSIAVELKNEFVINFANEAGIAIDPKYEQQFNEVLEKQGVERKFSIASVSEQLQSPVAEKQASKPITPSPEQGNRLQKERNQGAMELLLLQRPELDKKADEAEVEAVTTIQSEESKTLVHDFARKPARLAIAEVIASKAVRKNLPAMKLMVPRSIASVEPVSKVVAGTPQETAVVQPMDTSTADFKQVKEIDLASETEFTSLGLEQIHEATVIDFHTRYREEVLSENSPETTWDSQYEIALLTEQLQNEPAELYEGFTMALKAYDVGISQNINEASYSTMAEAETQQFLGVLAEHMQTADEAAKSQAALTLQQVIGAVHGLKLLEARSDVSLEARHQIEAALVATAQCLFKELGMIMDDADVAKFVVLLQDPEFIALLAGSDAVKQYVDTSMREARTTLSDTNLWSLTDEQGTIHSKIARWLLGLPVAA